MQLPAIEHAASLAPDALGLVTPDGQAISLGRVVETVRRFATGLRHGDVKAGQRVAVAVDNEAVRLLILLAALRLGAVPVLTSHVRQTQRHGITIDHIVALAEQMDDFANAIRFAQNWWSLPPDTAPPAPEKGQIFTTSGSTGLPKYMPYAPGVVAARSAHLASAIPPPSGPIMSGLGAMSSGGQRYIQRALVARTGLVMPGPSAAVTLDHSAEHGVAEFMAPGPMLADLTEARMAGAGAALQLKRIETVGSSVSEALLRNATSAFGCPVTVMYGTTEVGFLAVGEPLEGDYEPGLVGPILDGVEIRLVDAQGAAVQPNRTGRANVRVPKERRVMDYLNAPGPYDADGWFATADLLRIRDDGWVVHCGRVGDLINTGAQAWQPEIFEAAALTDSAVRHAAAFPTASVDGSDHVVLVIETDDPDAAARLRTILESTFQSVRRFYVMAMAELPRNTSGKIDRRALKKIHSETAD